MEAKTTFTAEDGQYIFETDNYILYGVSFDEDPMPGSLKA